MTTNEKLDYARHIVFSELKDKKKVEMLMAFFEKDEMEERYEDLKTCTLF